MKIHKGKQIPQAYKTPPADRKPYSRSKCNYPWDKFDISDAMCLGLYSKERMVRILHLANHSIPALYEGFKFQCRKIMEDDLPYLYIWRVK